MNIHYLAPRLIRHFMPASLTHLLLSRGWIIKPGLETRSPQEAAARYRDALAAAGCPLEGKRVLVFGYGGSFAIACGLLGMGAQHVTLCEKDARPDHARNAALLPEYSAYLTARGAEVLPNPAFISLAQGDIRRLAAEQAIQPVDRVLSTSVYEHLDDVPGITRALASLTRPDGVQLHYVDLRDHFFKYPFEMLSYSKQVWYGWLNPTSNHNRYRCRDYRTVFAQFFTRVEVDVLERDVAAFRLARARIRPEFLSGDEAEDAITLIRVLAAGPK